MSIDVLIDTPSARCALCVAQGSVLVGPVAVRAGRMAALAPGAREPIVAREDSRVLLCGGAPVDGPRHLWWNFVATTRERIEQAKDDWRAHRFGPRARRDGVDSAARGLTRADARRFAG